MYDSLNVKKYKKILMVVMLLTAIVILFQRFEVVEATSSSFSAPPKPSCASGSFLWENEIDVTNLSGRYGIPDATVRMKYKGTTKYTIPNRLPSAFDSQVDIHVTEAIAWDGYTKRTKTANQPNERYSLVFLKDGDVVHQTKWTGYKRGDGLATRKLTESWKGALGRATLPNGADEIVIAHWSDSKYGEGDTTSPNSVFPSSFCIEYETSEPKPTETPEPTPTETPKNLSLPPEPSCASGSFLWENEIDIMNLEGKYGIPDATMRMKYRGTTKYTIPDRLPTAFDSQVDIDITEAVAWDGYTKRPSSSDQPNERYSLVFLKDGDVVHQTEWTGDRRDDGLATGTIMESWKGSLGSTTLPNGADEIIIAHWSDSTYGEGDTTSPNSVFPSSFCIKYETPEPTPTPTRFSPNNPNQR